MRGFAFSDLPIQQSEHRVRFDGRNVFESLPKSMPFPLETWQNDGVLDEVPRLEGRALVHGDRHKCRAQLARGMLQLTLCDNFALTSALPKSVILVSIWSEWNSSHPRSRTHETPPRALFCDASNVGVQRSCSRTIAQGKGRSRSLRNEHTTRRIGHAERKNTA